MLWMLLAKILAKYWRSIYWRIYIIYWQHPKFRSLFKVSILNILLLILSWAFSLYFRADHAFFWSGWNAVNNFWWICRIFRVNYNIFQFKNVFLQYVCLMLNYLVSNKQTLMLSLKILGTIWVMVLHMEPEVDDKRFG